MGEEGVVCVCVCVCINTYRGGGGGGGEGGEEKLSFGVHGCVCLCVCVCVCKCGCYGIRASECLRQEEVGERGSSDGKHEERGKTLRHTDPQRDYIYSGGIFFYSYMYEGD